ncbi:MAG: ATP-grasp domain-containing protein, partial [Armatimonadia bacterium]|nr:ATP-grasp domain-containing protein [Armatimonadia bacterium]
MARNPILLVLGVGGNVSQGILKALDASSLSCRVIGGCIDAHSTGLYFADHAVISPLADDPEFPDWLVDTCLEHGVSGVLSGVEPVLATLAEHRPQLEARSGARILVSEPAKLALCADKLATARWLADHGLRAPATVAAEDGEGVADLVARHGYPLFAKPRRGKGSHGIVTIDSPERLAAVQGLRGMVIQEYVGDPDEEFTAATFTDADGAVRGDIVFQRDLLEGTTVTARAVHAPDVSAQVRAIAGELLPVGPANMQLRCRGGEPVCFEINLRFSGTAPIRARLGFNDVEAAVRHFIMGEPAA